MIFCESCGMAILMVFISLYIISFIIWVATLMHQWKRNRWGWFALTLVFNIFLLIYWIIWLVDPKFKNKKRSKKK